MTRAALFGGDHTYIYDWVLGPSATSWQNAQTLYMAYIWTIRRTIDNPTPALSSRAGVLSLLVEEGRLQNPTSTQNDNAHEFLRSTWNLQGTQKFCPYEMKWPYVPCPDFFGKVVFWSWNMFDMLRMNQLTSILSNHSLPHTQCLQKFSLWPLTGYRIMSFRRQQPVVPNRFPKLQRICMCKLHGFWWLKHLHIKTACAGACAYPYPAYPNYMCRGMCPPHPSICQHWSTVEQWQEQTPGSNSFSWNGLAAVLAF